MGYDETAEANCAKALAKFAQNYGYDGFTWRGTLAALDKPIDRYTVEVRLTAGDTAAIAQDAPDDLVDRLVSYRSNSEFGPVHHIICDEAATLIRQLISGNRQLVSSHADQVERLAHVGKTSAALRSTATALIAAFAGNVPDSVRDQASALSQAIAEAEEP